MKYADNCMRTVELVVSSIQLLSRVLSLRHGSCTGYEYYIRAYFVSET